MNLTQAITTNFQKHSPKANAYPNHQTPIYAKTEPASSHFTLIVTFRFKTPSACPDIPPRLPTKTITQTQQSNWLIEPTQTLLKNAVTQAISSSHSSVDTPLNNKRRGIIFRYSRNHWNPITPRSAQQTVESEAETFLEVTPLI